MIFEYLKNEHIYFYMYIYERMYAGFHFSFSMTLQTAAIKWTKLISLSSTNQENGIQAEVPLRSKQNHGTYIRGRLMLS